MRKILTFLSLFVSVVFSVQSQTQNNQQLLNFEVFINGKKFQVKEGDTLNIPNNQIVIKTSEYLQFDNGGLAFEYPKNFSLSFEDDPSYKMWTLDGSDLVVTYMVSEEDVELDEIIKEIVKKFDKNKCEIKAKELKIGDYLMKGKQLNVNILGSSIIYFMFKFESKDKKSHLLYFQDSKGEDGSDSEEFVKVMKHLNKTIKIN